MKINGSKVVGDPEHACDIWITNLRKAVKTARSHHKERRYNFEDECYEDVRVPPVETFIELLDFVNSRGYEVTHPEIFRSIYGKELV